MSLSSLPLVRTADPSLWPWLDWVKRGSRPLQVVRRGKRRSSRALLLVINRVKAADWRSSPHGEPAIYHGRELLGFVAGRRGFSHARSATDRTLGKFPRPNDAILAASKKLDGATP
jgi:hypothetical protein